MARYREGQPVKALCAEVGVSKRSFYKWIALYRESVTRTRQILTAREFNFLRRRVQKMEELLAVLQAVGCGVSAPLQEKLREMEKLYGQV